MQGVFCCVRASASRGISPTDPAAIEPPPPPVAADGSRAVLTKTLSKFILS